MRDFNVPLAPSQAAVLIGIFEILVCELVKITATYCTVWRLRASLHTQRYFMLPITTIQNDCNTRHHNSSPLWTTPRSRAAAAVAAVLAVQVGVLLTAVFLELSIAGSVFPTAHRAVDLKCFNASTAWNRAIQRGGIGTVSLQDERIPPYVKQIGCTDSLIAQSIAAPDAFIKGFPRCLSKFEARRVQDALVLQGSAVSVIANSMEGDPFLPYSVVSASDTSSATRAPGRANEHIQKSGINESDLTTDTFVSISVPSSEAHSTAYWTFGDDNGDERIISNVQLPYEMLIPAQRSPTNTYTDASDTLSCTANDISCFREYARRAHAIPRPVVQKYVEKGPALYMVSSRSRNSSICIFEKEVHVTMKWVFMSQSIPDQAERAGRNGPTPVSIDVSGDAHCIDGIKPMEARLHLNGMEAISLREALKLFKNNSTSHKGGGDDLAPRETLRNIMQTAAVLMGLKEHDGTACSVRAAYSGSTLGGDETVIAAAAAATALLAIVTLMVFGLRYRSKCTVDYDPLHVPSVLARVVSARQTLAGSQAGETAGSKGTTQRSPPPCCVGGWWGAVGRFVRALVGSSDVEDEKERDFRRVWVNFTGQDGGGGETQRKQWLGEYGVEMSQDMAKMPDLQRKDMLEADIVEKPQARIGRFIMSVTQGDDGRLDMNIAIP